MNLSKQRKCKGCGLPLSDNPNDLAYTPNFALPYCQRCFRLKHYGVDFKNELANNITQKTLKQLKINERDWIILINDVLNIDFKIIEQYQNHKNLLFVFNKIDLIIDNFNYSKFLLRITNLLNTVGIKQPHIIISSTINHYGIRKLFEFIQHLDWSEKIYFIGKTNSGKSSIVNSLIKYSGSLTKQLTVSKYLNTTIDVKQIKLLEHSIIDTPGYHSEFNILNNLVDLKDIGSISNKQRIRPIVFQIKEPQAFIANSLFWIKIITSTKASVTFYVPNKLKIQRTKIINLERNLKNPINNSYKVKKNPCKSLTFQLISNQKYNLMMEGLGLISFKGVNSIEFNTFSTVGINLLDDWII